MSELVKKLIEETEANCESLDQQVDEYEDIVNELLRNFTRERNIGGEIKQVSLGLSYYPYSYEGRKIVVGSGLKSEEEKRQEFRKMITDLVIEGQVKDFIEHLTKAWLPLYVKGEGSYPKFYF